MRHPFEYNRRKSANDDSGSQGIQVKIKIGLKYLNEEK
jgi:hypothetical protein